MIASRRKQQQQQQQQVLLYCCSLCFVLLLHATPTSTFSFGAGGCFASRPSVASIHLQQMKIISGTLEKGNFTVLLDGRRLSTTNTNPFTTNHVHTLTLKSTEKDGYFRGFLFRLGDPNAIPDPAALAVPGDAGTYINTSTTMISYIMPTDKGLPSSETQLAAACLLHNASGIGHTSNSKKTMVSALLQVPHAMSGIRLDITVVVQNRNHRSIFFYSGYNMEAMDKVPVEMEAMDKFPVERKQILFFVAIVVGIALVVLVVANVVKKLRLRHGKKKYSELTQMADDVEEMS